MRITVIVLYICDITEVAIEPNYIFHNPRDTVILFECTTYSRSHFVT